MIEIVPETGSTSADLSARLSSGEHLEEGHWLLALRQTAGRGRQGRDWSDGDGNFMGSTLVRLRDNDPAAHTLSLVAGIATYSAVEAMAPGLAGLSLKWPNDLMVKRSKLAGLLLERRGGYVIVGIGVNLAVSPAVPGRAVTSLSACGVTVDHRAFAEMLATCWDHALRLWHAGAWSQLRADWIARAHPFGTPLTVHGPDGEKIQGTFAGIDADGALQLQLSGGTRRTIHAGEVVLEHRR